jgi:hypothetical protein
MGSTFAYWIGLLCSAFATLFGLMVYGGRDQAELWPGDPRQALAWGEIRVLAVVVIPPLATLIAILWGWRRDRRRVQDLARQTQELARINDDLGLKLLSAQTLRRPPQTRQGSHGSEGDAIPRS